MLSEQSQQNAGGVLYLVAVPIGHRDDITLRAIRVLQDADIIVCENPAVTSQLLAHHNISTRLTSYGPTNITEKVAVLLDHLRRGVQIAFVSDCGSPVIADPGSRLIIAAHTHGIQVVSVPGPSALTAAIVAAGLPCDTMLFLGQLPETASEIRRRLSVNLAGRITMVAFCQSNTLAAVLKTITDLAPRRRLVLACDLTSPHERIVRGTACQIQQRVQNIQPSQDITLILMGRNTRNSKNKRGRQTGQN